MRSSMARADGMSWGMWLGAIVLAILVAGAAGLAIYGSTVHPVQHPAEQVLSNDRFPK